MSASNYFNLIEYFLITLLLYGSTFAFLLSFRNNLNRIGLSGIAVQSVIIVQVLKLGIMVLLSFFNKNTDYYIYFLYIYLVGLNIIIYIYRNQIQNAAKTTFGKYSDCLSLDLFGSIKFWASLLSVFFFFCFLFILVVRGFFFIDTTWDCKTYGLPKIALYFQNQSIFHISESQDFRINSLERNGELNFLHTLLLNRTPAIIGLTAIEVWISIVIGIYALARSAGAKTPEALWISTLVSSAPIIFGMTGVTKGDSLAVVYLVFATYFLLVLAKDGNSPYGFFFFILSLSLTCGSKMTASFGVLVLLGVLLINYRKWHFPNTVQWIILIFCIAIASSKQLQNIILYAHPFPKPPWVEDISGFEINNLFQGVRTAAGWFFPLKDIFQVSGFVNDMEKNMGLTFFIVGIGLLFITLNFVKQKSNFSELIWKPEAQTIFFVLVGACAVMAYVQTNHIGFVGNWFRYLMPYAAILATISLAVIARGCDNHHKQRAVLILLSLLAFIFNLMQATRPSFIFTAPGRSAILNHILSPKYQDPRDNFCIENESIYKVLRKYETTVSSVYVAQLDQDIPVIPAFGNNFTWYCLIKPTLDFNRNQKQPFDVVYVTTRSPELTKAKFLETVYQYEPVWQSKHTLVFILKSILDKAPTQK